MGIMVDAAADAQAAVAVVRLRRGVVGESRRVCHVVPIPETGPVPSTLTALCGEAILPRQAEVLESISGMPCVACLARSRGTATAGLPAAG
jgi:hypothetical protein